jgi:hypothetical protein
MGSLVTACPKYEQATRLCTQGVVPHQAFEALDLRDFTLHLGLQDAGDQRLVRILALATQAGVFRSAGEFSRVVLAPTAGLLARYAALHRHIDQHVEPQQRTADQARELLDIFFGALMQWGHNYLEQHPHLSGSGRLAVWLHLLDDLLEREIRIIADAYVSQGSYAILLEHLDRLNHIIGDCLRSTSIEDYTSGQNDSIEKRRRKWVRFCEMAQLIRQATVPVVRNGNPGPANPFRANRAPR